MKKFVKFVGLAVMVGVLVAGCSKNSDPTVAKPGGSVVTPAPSAPAPTTTTTVDTTSALVATCASTGTDLASVAGQYIDTLQANVYIVVTEPSVSAAAISTGRELSSTLRQWAATCRSVSPSAASSAVDLAGSIDNIVGILVRG